MSRFSFLLPFVLCLTPARAEEKLPPHALARLGSTRFLHSDWIDRLTFLPGNRHLLSSAHEGHAHIWDVTTGQQVRRLDGGGGRVWSAVLSPDGTRVAAGNGAGVSVWSVATGKTVAWFGLAGDGPGAVAWGPDSKTLAFYHDGALCLWRLDVGKILDRMKGRIRSIRSVAFTPDGTQVVAATDERVFRVWEVATGRECPELEGQADGSGHVSFRRDGRLVAADCAYPLGPRSTRTLVRIWDWKTGKKVRDLDCASSHAVAFAPDGRTLATADCNRMIHLWDPNTGKRLHSWVGNEASITALAFTSDGRRLASGGGDGRIRLWDTRTGKEIFIHPGHTGSVECLAWAPDGRTIASASQDGTVRLWNWPPAQPGQRTLVAAEPGHTVHALAWTPDGKKLVSADADAAARGLRLWDARTATLLRRFGQPCRNPQALAMLSDGKHLFTVDVDGYLLVWNLTKGQACQIVDRLSGFWPALALSPDRRTLALALPGAPLYLWETASGRLLRQCEGKLPVGPAVVAFTANGEQLASWGAERTVHFWDVHTGKRLEGKGIPAYGTFALSPDGLLLATSNDRLVSIWEVPTGKLVREDAGHQREVRTLTFRPDGQVLLSGGRDGLVYAWDVSTYHVAGRLRSLSLEQDQARQLWERLGSLDAALGQHAAWTLAAWRGLFPFVRHHVRPVTAIDPAQRQKWIAELDDDSFVVREKATRALKAAGDPVVPALRQTLSRRVSLEVRIRIEEILQAIEKGVEQERIRAARIVAVLERSRCPAALRLLDWLARGEPEASLTRRARAARARLVAVSWVDGR